MRAWRPPGSPQQDGLAFLDALPEPLFHPPAEPPAPRPFPLRSVVAHGRKSVDLVIEKEQFTAMQSLIPSLAVKDVAASLRFYTDVLGFETSFTMPDASGELIHASIKRGDVEIMFGRLSPDDAHDQGPLGRGVHLYTTVADAEDIDGLFAHARKSGAHVVQEPTDQFWGHRDWTVADPDGYLVVVSKVTRSVSAEKMQEAAMAGAPAD